MKKLLVAALIVPLALLGAARPAKAGSKAGAILTGVAVGVGAALILDALVPRPVVAAPVVVAPPPVVYAPLPVVYAPPSVVYTPHPVIVTPPPVVYHASPAVVYRPAPLIVRGPRHVVHRPHAGYHHPGHGKGHWKDKRHYRHRDHDD
jgi:hypothetical protein